MRRARHRITSFVLALLLAPYLGAQCANGLDCSLRCAQIESAPPLPQKLLATTSAGCAHGDHSAPTPASKHELQAGRDDSGAPSRGCCANVSMCAGSSAATASPRAAGADNPPALVGIVAIRTHDEWRSQVRGYSGPARSHGPPTYLFKLALLI